jgi:TDG/mug DNA glycosylase family protein
MSVRTREWRPTRDQLAAARGKTVPDVIAAGLRVLFCGINPGLYSGAVGHHFARPGNRFWQALHLAGFTDRRLSPFEERALIRFGIGVTNLVRRATASADELSRDELRSGAGRLRRAICRHRPAVVAFLGLGAYRVGFGERRASVGAQGARICGTEVWLLPNPSGINAHYQLRELVAAFRRLRDASSRPRTRAGSRGGVRSPRGAGRSARGRAPRGSRGRG